MKKGDIVTIGDASYNMVLRNGKILDLSGCTLFNRNCEVIETGIYVNDCDIIVKALDNKDIIYTCDRFLKLVHRCNICPNCGENIK